MILILKIKIKMSDPTLTGGYGSVEFLSDTLVVKKIKFDTLNHISSFLREVGYTRKFRHPGINTILEWKVENNTGFLYMERGILIEEALNQGLITVVEIIVQLFSVVCFLSRHGILHNDLKLENIIFCDGRLKLIDFGLTDSCTLFKNGYFSEEWGATEEYRDPEKAVNGFSSIKTDLFSISIIISCIDYDNEYIDLVEACSEFMSKRKSIEDLIREYNIGDDTVGEVEECKISNITDSDLMMEGIKTILESNCSSRCLLWALSIFGKVGKYPRECTSIASFLCEQCYFDVPLSSEMEIILTELDGHVIFDLPSVSCKDEIQKAMISCVTGKYFEPRYRSEIDFEPENVDHIEFYHLDHPVKLPKVRYPNPKELPHRNMGLDQIINSRDLLGVIPSSEAVEIYKLVKNQEILYRLQRSKKIFDKKECEKIKRLRLNPFTLDSLEF